MFTWLTRLFSHRVGAGLAPAPYPAGPRTFRLCADVPLTLDLTRRLIERHGISMRYDPEHYIYVFTAPDQASHDAALDELLPIFQERIRARAGAAAPSAGSLSTPSAVAPVPSGLREAA